MADLTEAIEAVARAMFTETQGARGPLYDPPSWGELVPGVQQSWRTSARAAVQAAAPIIERHVRVETAEGIARAIEARGKAAHDFLDRAELPVNPRYAETIVLAIADAAAIARGFKHPGFAGETGTPTDAPAQPTQERPLS